MFGAGRIFQGEAYQDTQDMEQHRNQITSLYEGYRAKKYSIDFRVRTLIGPGPFAESTTIGFDLDVRNYPYEEPATWIISSHVPYSPHFKPGSPVCIGEVWQRARGRMLLGHLLVHIAKLLNWDENARSGYVGWNPEAIAYHQQIYGGKPLTEGLQYPILPPEVYGLEAQAPVPWFRPLETPELPSETSGEWFKGKGIVP
jgi:hypothetical protein